ncbi:hypothetical protein G6O67_004697 [Ophiocordyceps sinensis]|uniref:Uncharacterized protein n=1 Tax=Ophiocordyceps sinensis TaxID=72228 RepID=A0A8H4V4X7_9HYPO|nr:hypothetical protein G6O67_004697 [Ophiocordyceps sinensis]
MSGLQKALPVALAVFCGFLGGYHTFEPMFAPNDLPHNDGPIHLQHNDGDKARIDGSRPGNVTAVDPKLGSWNER